MNKLNIRIKFCITIGVAIFLFSMVSNIAFFNVLRDGMQNARTKLEDNVAYINDQYATESEEETPHPSLSGNMYKETKEDIMIDRSSETYQAALNILNETFQDTIAKTFIWSLMLGLIGFILSYPLSGLLLKPFKELTSDIANINEGNLDKQLYITNRHDEIGKIKIAFNRLLVRLDTLLERQSNFTSNVAHELKTPLAVMKMYPETLDEDSTIEDYKKVIEVEKKNVDRMSALVDDLLANKKKYTAIIAVNDLVAFGVISQLKHCGYSIPADFSVISFDNIPYSSMISPALTTVDVVATTLAKQACIIKVVSFDRQFDNSLV